MGRKVAGFIALIAALLILGLGAHTVGAGAFQADNQNPTGVTTVQADNQNPTVVPADNQNPTGGTVVLADNQNPTVVAAH